MANIFILKNSLVQGPFLWSHISRLFQHQIRWFLPSVSSRKQNENFSFITRVCSANGDTFSVPRGDGVKLRTAPGICIYTVMKIWYYKSRKFSIPVYFHLMNFQKLIVGDEDGVWLSEIICRRSIVGDHLSRNELSEIDFRKRIAMDSKKHGHGHWIACTHQLCHLFSLMKRLRTTTTTTLQVYYFCFWVYQLETLIFYKYRNWENKQEEHPNHHQSCCLLKNEKFSEKGNYSDLSFWLE
jgi:hypothetical protein